MRRLTRSLSFRLLATAALWLTATLLAGGFVLSAAFRDYVVSDFDARLGETLDQMAGASEIDEAGLLRFTRPLADPRFAEPYSGWYWQISVADQPPFVSRSLWDRILDPDLGEGLSERRLVEVVGPEQQNLRLIAQDILLPDAEQPFRYMVAGDTAQIARDIRRFDRLILASLGFLGAGLLASILLQIWIGLLPLRSIRRGLANIRSGRARRLEDDFPLEIAPLAEEMNLLLAQNERVVERARTHVGNLAHALKTPLTVLLGEARGESSKLAGSVRAQAAIMGRHIDHHLKRARAAGGGLVGSACEIAPVIGDLVRAMEKIHAERRTDFVTNLEPGLRYRGTAQDLSEMVGNLLDNAAKWAHRRVHVCARPIESRDPGPMLEIRVEDDGPGVAGSEIEQLFERGRRLDESKPGSGLGLAIVRDIAELSGGDIRLERAPSGGLAAILRLPACP